MIQITTKGKTNMAHCKGKIGLRNQDRGNTPVIVTGNPFCLKCKHCGDKAEWGDVGLDTLDERGSIFILIVCNSCGKKMSAVVEPKDFLAH